MKPSTLAQIVLFNAGSNVVALGCEQNKWWFVAVSMFIVAQAVGLFVMVQRFRGAKR